MKYLIMIIFAGFFVVTAGLIYLYSQIRFDAYRIIDYSPKLSTQIFDRNGELVANIFEKHHRLYVNYNEIPARAIEALVAIEDTAFFEHKGLNYEAIFRAVIKVIEARSFVEGASTITQQLVKNTVLTREKKIIRKIKEALLAFKVESELTKEQILERYLNHVYFGSGYYGIRTASIGYFRKNLDELTLKEIAILVGLPRAPSAYDPTRNIDLSLSRANRVLYRMHTLGWISEKEYRVSLAEVPIVYDDTLTRNRAPYVVDEVIRRASQKYEDFRTGGYEIHLSIDLKLQELARKSLEFGHSEIIKRHPQESNSTILNGALVSLDVQSGDILAMVGGVNYRDSHFNRAVQSRRQPGSSFKPFIYQKALDVGYSTMSEIPDISRVYIDEAREEDWRPKNYGESFEGLVTLKDALVHSRNLATINLTNALGLDSVYRDLRSDGFRELPHDLSLSLGSFGISPLELSGFYSSFSNYGTRVEPVLIKKIVDRFGTQTVYESEKTRVTSPEQAFLIVDILRSAVERGTGKRARVAGIEVAGKTGTTNKNVDAWFCGFTPEIKVVVWYGNDDNSPMQKKETGGRVAAPAFTHFIKGYIDMYPQTKREFAVPKGVAMKIIDGKKEFFTKTSPFLRASGLDESEDGGMLF